MSCPTGTFRTPRIRNVRAGKCLYSPADMMNWAISAKGWTAVDGIDGPAVCAVSVRAAARGQRPMVQAVVEAEHAGTSAIDALRQAVSGTEKGLPIVVTLPRERYRLRVMPEPMVPVREMTNSLRWALSSESDNPLEDFNLAWMRIPTEASMPARPKQVYTVQTPSPWLAERMVAWREGGLRPKVVDIRETALRNIAGALERPGEGLVLVTPERDGVGMVFTHGGSLFMDRFIEQPEAELRAADAAARLRLHERIAVQLLRSVDVVARSFPFMPISRVIVAPPAEPTGLFEFLSAQLPLAVEPLDLSQVFDLSRAAALAEQPQLQSRCLVALGATLRHAREATA